MLIAAIVILSFFVLAYIGILIFHFLDLKKDDYEYIVRAPKLTTIVAHAFYIFINIGISAGAVVLMALVENDTYGGLIFIVLFLGSLSLLLLIVVIFPFVAVKEKSIYKRTLFTIKVIKIEDVRSVDCYKCEHYIVLKNGSRITVNAGSDNAEELLKLIRDRKAGKIYSLNPNNIEQTDTPNDAQNLEEKEERITLTQIGKEFRENFSNYKRKQMIISVGGVSSIILIIAGGCLAFFLKDKKPFWVFLLVGCAFLLLMFIGIFIKIVNNLDKELQHDDEWLGNKHKFDDARVKGCAKKKFKSLLPLFIVVAACSSLIGVICGVEGNRKPVSQSRLIEATGKLEYFRNSGDKFEEEYAIGLKDDITEYRICSYDSSPFDSSFKTEVPIGDVVTILIDSTRKPASINYEGRTQWNYAYAVSAKGKDYFTYDNYLSGFNKNQQETKVVFVVCVSITGLCLLGIAISFALYKARSKKETIDI